MSIKEQDLIPTWKVNVPQDFEELYIRATYDAYRGAHEYCILQKFNQSEKRSVRPQIRWGLMEKSLREIAQQLNLPSWDEPNYSKSHNHHRIICGAVSFTQSHVTRRNEMPKFAFFRHSLAIIPQQRLLFQELEQSPVEPPEVYGIITHSERHQMPWLPDFIDVLFPISGTEAAPPRMRLMDVYANLVASIESIQAEDVFEIELIDDLAMPQLLDEFTNRKTGTDDK